MFEISRLTDFGNPRRVLISDIVTRIREDKKVKAVCEAVRSETDTEAKRRLKLTLPAFVMGEFDGKLTNSAFVKSDYLLFDIDNVDMDRIPGLKEGIASASYLVFISPSGNGIKFAIKLSSPVVKENYRVTYEHYANYFSDLFGVELDRQTKDPSRKCYYSYDPDVRLNEKHRPYSVLKPEHVDRIANVETNAVSEDELTDVCQYLQGVKLSYAEWTVAAMALHYVESQATGYSLFVMVSQSKYYSDDENTIRAKWNQCANVRQVTLASLFWLAMSKGYQRRHKYLKSASKYPFHVDEEGSWFREKDDKLTWAFGWKEIEYLYDVKEVTAGWDLEDMELNSPIDGGGFALHSCLRIDKREILVPAAALTVPVMLKKEIARNISVHFAQNKAERFFNTLSEYLHRTKKGAHVTLVRGVGRITPNIWNWGNYVLLEGKVYDYEPIIWTSENSGYMLERYAGLNITPSKGIKTKIERLHYFYGDQIALALGWAIANLYYLQVHRNYGGFPILFLHGDTGKGKSKLGNLILAMFGVSHPDSDKNFKATLENMTNIAGTRLKSSIFCMPTFFDEYNGGHYHLLKSLYDGSGRVTAIRDHTNRVKRSSVHSGTITASLFRPHEKEVLNRCVYYDVMKSVDDRKAAAFNLEMMTPEAHQELSALAINIAVKNLEEDYLEILRDSYKYLMDKAVKSTEAVGRIALNYAIAHAGFKLLVKHGVVKEYAPKEMWLGWVNDTITSISEADPVESFLTMISRLAGKSVMQRHVKSAQQYIQMPDGSVVEGTRYTVFLREVWGEIQELCKRSGIFPDLLGMTYTDMARLVRKSRYCHQKPRTARIAPDQWNPNEAVSTAYYLDVPADDEALKDDNTDEPIPF